MTHQQKPTGTLTIPRSIAERWVPWFATQVADIRNEGHLGKSGFISAISNAATEKLSVIGDAKEIVFRNMTPALVQTLTDFHRRVYGHSDAPIFYALGAGWRGPAEVQPEVPADDLERCKRELEKPYVAPEFVPASEVKEVKPSGSLF